MSTKYKALIIGCGNMGVLNDAPGSGNEHKTISYAKALRDSGRFEVYYHDRNPDKVAFAINTWGGSWHIKPKYDLVIIATPDDTHYELIKESLKVKPDLIICEKPLCSTVDEAYKIMDMCEAAEVQVMVDYTRRFIPHWQDVKKRYKAGEYGKLLSANYVFNRGWLHTGTHITDFHQWMFGDANGKIMEVGDADYRIWSMDLFFEKWHMNEHRIGNSIPVSSIYDKHTEHVIKNAIDNLDYEEPLMCTMYDALWALEKMERLQEV